ncbi:hypothetical protein F4T90_00345 [Acinetobacter junii]|uniref:hypothetical protein n=1 Tax=Acinetobacter junii TaxID=40215 RepID=UPI00129867A8|nr:hypothetical protein [Acinetobacter junii]MQZ55909.1 hypothetical protein [Acinetobacter junii]
MPLQQNTIAEFEQALQKFKAAEFSFVQLCDAFFALDLTLQEQLAQEADLPENLQLKLVEEGSDEVREHLAKNRSISYVVQRTLLGSMRQKDREVCCNLAQNPAITPKIQHLLALPKEHWSWDTVFYVLAKNPALCLDVQKVLSQHSCDSARYSLAQNPILEKEIIGILSDDPYSEVRKWLASNPSISEDIMWKLATAKDDTNGTKDVLRYLARYANIQSQDLREYLLAQAEKIDYRPVIEQALKDNGGGVWSYIQIYS